MVISVLVTEVSKAKRLVDSLAKIGQLNQGNMHLKIIQKLGWSVTIVEILT